MDDFGVAQWDNKPSDIPTEQGSSLAENDPVCLCVAIFLSQ